MNKVYCHTTYFDYKKYSWYFYNEIDSLYVIRHSEFVNLARSFYKQKFSTIQNGPLFSDYFYTEQEYNRIKNLEELLNGE